MRKWTANPLRRVSEIESRQAAVGELSTSESTSVSLLKKLVSKLPDLEKMLCSTYHKKVNLYDTRMIKQWGLVFGHQLVKCSYLSACKVKRGNIFRKYSHFMGCSFSLHINVLSFQCSPLDFCILMHHLTDISRQVEALSETALTDLKSELLHSVIKEVDT